MSVNLKDVNQHKGLKLFRNLPFYNFFQKRNRYLKICDMQTFFFFLFFSIHSGDSDLIGVEDNPEFDYEVKNVSIMA